MSKTANIPKNAALAALPLAAILLFAYFLLHIKPFLYYTAQEPVFFFDPIFFREFLAYPGGLLEYVADLLAQFFYTPVLGALVLTIIFALIFWLMRLFVRRIVDVDPGFLALLPLTILLAAHNSYNHNLVVDLTLLAVLAGALLYTILPNLTSRVLFHLFFFPLLYFAIGGGFLLFALLVICYELIKQRNFLPALLAIVLAIVLPCISGAALFLIRLKHAFWSPIFPEAILSAFYGGLYLSVPVFVLLAFLLKKGIKSLAGKSAVLSLVTMGVCLALFFGIPFLTFKTQDKIFWQINACARSGQWNELLELSARPHNRTIQTTFQINRALCHTGKMGAQLFCYPQDFGTSGLYLFDDERMSTPLLRSDLYFDLGHYNEAKHWAHEAVAVTGESAWNLQRLATIYLLYGEKDIAALYLNKLEKTIPLRKWAQQHKKYLTTASLRDDARLGPLLANRVSENFLSFVNNPVPDLYKLLHHNSRNKFAADYLLASLLLNKQLPQFVRVVDGLIASGQTTLPAHYQEALLAYLAQTPDGLQKLKSYNIDNQTKQRFQEFQTSLRANKNRGVAQKALAAYAGTYWYYLVFHGQESK